MQEQKLRGGCFRIGQDDKHRFGEEDAEETSASMEMSSGFLVSVPKALAGVLTSMSIPTNN